jgi:hypothetical protein
MRKGGFVFMVKGDPVDPNLPAKDLKSPRVAREEA